jgi:hypothetical protein
LQSKIPSTLSGNNTKYTFGAIVATAAAAAVIHYLAVNKFKKKEIAEPLAVIIIYGRVAIEKLTAWNRYVIG